MTMASHQTFEDAYATLFAKQRIKEGWSRPIPKPLPQHQWDAANDPMFGKPMTFFVNGQKCANYEAGAAITGGNASTIGKMIRRARRAGYNSCTIKGDKFTWGNTNA